MKTTKAKTSILLYHEKSTYEDGFIYEMKLRQVATPVRGSKHAFKYSLYYGWPGKGQTGRRIIGYDNEAGKGDHRHYNDREERYEFVSVEKLLQDFLQDIARERGR